MGYYGAHEWIFCYVIYWETMSRIGQPKKHGRQMTLNNAFNFSRHDANVEEDVDFEYE